MPPHQVQSLTEVLVLCSSAQVSASRQHVRGASEPQPQQERGRGIAAQPTLRLLSPHTTQHHLVVMNSGTAAFNFS